MREKTEGRGGRKADVWTALADGTRRKIVLLLKHRPHTAGELADQFELSGATVSHHLGVLRESGLIVCERRGQTLIYSLDKAAMQAFSRAVSELIN